MPAKRPEPALSARTWQVLGLLWAAGQRGGALTWTYSRTIELSLIDRHVPPLAERVGPPIGYAITERGRDFYREHYATHAAAYPDVYAPHPDGAAAEPWPARADEILARHRLYYQSLGAAWQAATDAHRSAETEASAAPAALPSILPAAVAAQAAERHQLWRDTAQARAELAAAHAEDLHVRAEQAARAYAVAALAAFRAAALRTDPLAVLEPSGEADDWDEQRLALPPETGIHAIDAEVKKLHAAAVCAPLPRRGPAPKRRRARHAPPATAKQPPLPGAALAALADFLRRHVDDGALTRRLHPPGPD